MSNIDTNTIMLDDSQLRMLAKQAIQDGMINQKVAEFALQRLSPSQLRQFVTFLKGQVEKQNVYVRVADDIDNKKIDELKKFFQGKSLHVTHDDSLGGGLTVRDNDTIIDMSVKGYIRSAVNTVKNDL